MIEQHEGGTFITGPDIEVMRLRTLRAALSIEIKTGMKRSRRGRPTLVLVNEALGHARGSKGYISRKDKAYTALDTLLAEKHNIRSRPLLPRGSKESGS